MQIIDAHARVFAQYADLAIAVMDRCSIKRTVTLEWGDGTEHDHLSQRTSQPYAIYGLGARPKTPPFARGWEINPISEPSFGPEWGSQVSWKPLLSPKWGIILAGSPGRDFSDVLLGLPSEVCDKVLYGNAARLIQ